MAAARVLQLGAMRLRVQNAFTGDELCEVLIAYDDSMRELLQSTKFELDKIPLPNAKMMYKLMYQGKVLTESCMTVFDFGLVDGSTIHAVMQPQDVPSRNVARENVARPRVTSFIDVRETLLKAAVSKERPGFWLVQTAYHDREAYYQTMQANVLAEFQESFDQSRASSAVLITGGGFSGFCGLPFHQCTHRFNAKVVKPDTEQYLTEAERKANIEEDRATLESLKDNIVSARDGDEERLFWITSVEVKEPRPNAYQLAADIRGIGANGNALEHSGAQTLRVRLFAGDFASRYRACTSLLSGQEASCLELERALLNPRNPQPGTYRCRRTRSSLESHLRCNTLPINKEQLDAVHGLQYRVEVIHGPPGTGKSTTICHTLSAHLPRGAAAVVTCVCNQAIDAIAEKLARNQDPAKQGHPMLVLGNAKRVGPTARQYTLEEQCKREEHVVFMEKIVSILSKRVTAARELQRAREKKFLAGGAEMKRSRLTIIQLAGIPGLRRRALKDLLRAHDKDPFFLVNLRMDPSDMELEQRWRRVQMKENIGSHVTVEAKMQEVHVQVMSRCRAAMARAAARSLRIDRTGRSQDPRRGKAGTIDIGSYLQYEEERLSVGYEWLGFAKDRAPHRVVRRTHVFLCTIPSSYRVESLREDYLEDFPPNVSLAICDEAAATAETYVPQMMSLSVENLVLLGDHKQLPPLVLAQNHKDVAHKRVARSLMERMLDGGHPSHQLRTQYRMPDILCKLVSQLFYEGELSTAPEKHETDARAGRMDRIRWFDGESGTSPEVRIGTSYVNVAEVSMVLHLLQKDPVLSRTRAVVRVITFYKPQLSLFQTVFSELGLSTSMPHVELTTVDACQGTEAPHIILSTVRSVRDRIGFASDPRRLNVAISRAQLSLTIVGCGHALSGDDNWAVVYEWFRTHGVVSRLRDSATLDNASARREAERMAEKAAVREAALEQKGLKGKKGGKGLGKDRKGCKGAGLYEDDRVFSKGLGFFKGKGFSSGKSAFGNRPGTPTRVFGSKGRFNRFDF